MSKEQKFDVAELLETLQNFDPNDIDWENMGSWPLIGKISMCLVISLAVISGWFFLQVQPVQEQLAKAEQAEISLKQDFERKAFSVANLIEYKAQMSEMENSFGALLKQLPRDTEVPGLIDDISLAAIDAGLELKLIAPGKYSKTEFYTELPIQVEVEGGYHELAGFVSAVASLPRIVTLHDYSISKPQKGSRLKMKILAKTYKYNEEQ